MKIPEFKSPVPFMQKAAKIFAYAAALYAILSFAISEFKKADEEHAKMLNDGDTD